MALIKLNNRSSEDNAIHGRRNLIINGDFQINQRSVTSSTSNGFLADRWYCGVDNTHTQAIVSDAPEGFKYSHKITVGSASANTVLGYFFTKIEAQNIITPLGWDGAGNGSNAVLSFWVKSSVTGKYSTYSRNNADTENYIKTFTINSANTWEYKTLSITPPTAGTWTTDNTSGLQLSFGLSGSASANAVASEGWHTANYIMTTDSTDLYTNAGATWQITGIQLEKGDIATPFEHRSFGEEWDACQRYCTVYNVGAGNTHPQNLVSPNHPVPGAPGHNDVSNRPEWFMSYPVKRATPTITVSDPTFMRWLASSNVVVDGNGSVTFPVGTGHQNANVFQGVASGIATSNVPLGWVHNNGGTYPKIIIDAEL